MWLELPKLPLCAAPLWSELVAPNHNSFSVTCVCYQYEPALNLTWSARTSAFPNKRTSRRYRLFRARGLEHQRRIRIWKERGIAFAMIGVYGVQKHSAFLYCEAYWFASWPVVRVEGEVSHTSISLWANTPKTIALSPNNNGRCA